MPAVFAFADKVIGNPQTALFAAFGSIAMLVLIEFTGPMRSRFVAYLALACVGAGNIVLGTFCSRNAWLAAGAMAVVGFAILFSGVINGYFAAAATPALLTFILPVTIPVSFSEVPARLAGWGLAAAAAICAHMLLWPARSRATLRSDAARACRALADLAENELADDQSAIPSRTAAAREAVESLRRSFLAAPHRPNGPTGPTAALASLVDELDWVLSFLAPRADLPSLDLCREENAEAVAATVAALRASAATLAGGDERPNFERIEVARDAVARALVRRISELPPTLDDDGFGSALEAPFRVRVISYSARQVAGYALLASGMAAPELDELDVAGGDFLTRPTRGTLLATERYAVEHAGTRSVWFRNSVRGAAGLAVAVYIAQRSGLQHSFWVVLGALSVLRSNALSTGWSVLTALAGTAVGIVLGAALVIAIGTHEYVLWAVLPVAVLLAAYAPRAISFAAGQAGFTVVLFVLFNIIQPTGWTVGLVRIEDVAIGFAISLGVGLLFWPRGAATVLRESLASAYGRSADYVVATAGQIIAGGGQSGSAGPADAAAAAVHQLDDAFRQTLAERSAGGVNLESVGALVAGAARVRRAAQSLSALGRMTDGDPGLTQCGQNLDGEIHALRSWYITLGDSFIHSTAIPPPHIRDTQGRRRLLDCVRAAVAGGDRTKVRSALVLLWANQHLDDLWRLESHLGRSAAEASSDVPPH
ncbi:MAG: FUSC family protein [Actinomycetota bacterium]|nr:FUSC family protein [Actinomycetota bacterium]